MAKASKKKKNVSPSSKMLSLFQQDRFAVFFLLSISTILGSSLYLMYSVA